MSKLEDLLNKGLEKGFAGQSNFEDVGRGLFKGEASQPDLEDGEYRDEWFGSRASGGQELARVDGKGITRFYGGEALVEDALIALGTNGEEVRAKLKTFILESKGKTRLRNDYSAVIGDWTYAYTAEVPVQEFPNTFRGLELIRFKGESVFIHLHNIAPLE